MNNESTLLKKSIVSELSCTKLPDYSSASENNLDKQGGLGGEKITICKKFSIGKKALSPVIATVLLISISLSLAAIILLAAKNSLSDLSPPVICDGLSFRAEISIFPSESTIDIENIGTLQIEGIQIKSVNQGEIKLVEEIIHTIEPGKTESIEVSGIFEETSLLITPMILRDEIDGKELRPCRDIHSLEI